MDSNLFTSLKVSSGNETVNLSIEIKTGFMLLSTFNVRCCAPTLFQKYDHDSTFYITNLKHLRDYLYCV